MSSRPRPPLHSRERVRRAVRFGRPDRAPISHAVLPAAQLKYGAALAEILAEYREDFGWDFMDDLPVARFPALYRQGLNRDDFGTLWRVEWTGVCGIPVDWPIKDLSRYEEYKLAAGFCGRAARGPAVQRPPVRVRRPLVRPRRLDHLFRAAPAAPRHGEPVSWTSPRIRPLSAGCSTTCWPSTCAGSTSGRPSSTTVSTSATTGAASAACSSGPTFGGASSNPATPSMFSRVAGGGDGRLVPQRRFRQRHRRRPHRDRRRRHQRPDRGRRP